MFKESDAALGAAEAAVMTLSDGAVKTWPDGYRKVIDGLHGRSRNAGWEAAGFTYEGTQVPRNHANRLTLQMAARTYLVAHPTAGATISVYVIAANEGGEAAPSPTVTKVVGS